jgi:hypothetical protein
MEQDMLLDRRRRMNGFARDVMRTQRVQEASDVGPSLDGFHPNLSMFIYIGNTIYIHLGSIRFMQIP